MIVMDDAAVTAASSLSLEVRDLLSLLIVSVSMLLLMSFFILLRIKID